MAKDESAVKVVLVLVIIAAFSAMLLAYVNQVTRGPIEENKRLEVIRAIEIVFKGLPEYTVPDEAKYMKFDNSSIKYYPATTKDGILVGNAIISMAPNGFSGEFPVMTGLDSTGKIIDTYVLEHKETPGLGDKMTHENFKGQFKGKGIADAKWKVKKDGGDIDAITAATITSRAFTDGVYRALEANKVLMEENK